nr:ribosome silencing factor [bacterium]
MAFKKKLRSKKASPGAAKTKAKAKPNVKAKTKLQPKKKTMAKAALKGRPASRAQDTSRDLAERIVQVAAGRKAIDIVVLDLRKLTSFADYFVIMSGSSDRQVGAIAEAVRHELKSAGRLPISEEGVRQGHWALIDYGDVVLHV